MRDYVELDISITINAGAELLTNTLEDAWVAAYQIADLVEYFRGRLEGMRLPDDPESCRAFNAALSGMGLISRDAGRIEETLRKLHELTECAAGEVMEKMV
jgi:hypothetical protein